MPCRVEEDWEPRKETRHDMTIDDFEAVLCGLFTAMEKHPVSGENMLDLWLSNVDWKEAGVQRREVKTWWRKHKAEDERRRRLEAEERRKAELKASALNKLTAEERAALGLK